MAVHEFAHGWVANKLGDPTARYSGRLTLNPLAHIDPVGTLVVPILLIISRAPIIFGWAKPVPVNFLNLRNPKGDMVWVGLSGPLANFCTAFLLSLLIKSGIINDINTLILLSVGIWINLALGIFNLLPIPPLDGSRIATGLLPERFALIYNSLEPFGFVIILIALWFFHLDRLIFLAIALLAGKLGAFPL
jgi:Zn-dependent protease